MRTFNTFDQAIQKIERDMVLLGYPVHSEKWQGVEIIDRPEAEMRELFDVNFRIMLKDDQPLSYWQEDIRPNLPWADVHFEQERMSGLPINPGESWKIWPWGHSAGNFLDADNGTRFNHTYAERYWPKYAGLHLRDSSLRDGILSDPVDYLPRRGIRYEYADLDDLVRHLSTHLDTRQGYLPVWFPEDGSHDDRKPCTLGYHFIHRHGYFHMTYYIRSCDLVRHFRDDLYLSLRLQMAILDRLRAESSELWEEVKLGYFIFNCVSLHCFINDFKALEDLIQFDCHGEKNTRS